MEQIKQRYLIAKRRLFDKVYSSVLNPEQRRATFTAKGPLLVLAGAGSGKTTVLVNRVAFLIKYGNAYFSENVPEDITEGELLAMEGAYDLDPVEIEHLLPAFAEEPASPWSILAITFTNKAAREMRERLSRTFTDSTVAESIWALTFHSFCLRVLRKYGDRLGLREGFSIYDTDDKKRMLLLCMKDLGIDEKRITVRAIANEISRAKDNLRTPKDYRAEAQDRRHEEIAKVYDLYERRLMQYNAVDFDDIIMKTVELLQNDAEACTYYQRKFKYILIDEYQDTNYAQFVLTAILARAYNNIMVVGDDDQSIYRFRGATIENILNFDKSYPECSVIKLEENYRSTETILDAANAIVKNNTGRHEKSLWSKKGRGEPIILREVYDQAEEGRYILDKIMSGVKNEGKKYSDFAVLYRVNELARSLETSFAKSGVPYKILGSMRFYDRKEIKDIIAYLSVINTPEDSLRLKRIINEPRRKIGDATILAVESISEAEGISMYEIMRRAGNYEALKKSENRLLAFVQMIDNIRESLHMPTELIERIFCDTGYRSMLEAEGFEGEGKIANVKEFISAAAEYEKRCSDLGEEASLSGFLEEISLVTDLDKYDESADAVVLMTIHAAKGLEFPEVFLAGMEDGIFPGTQSIGDEEEMSEERRLMYVAITRAKERIYVLHTKSRMMYGKTAYNPLSMFVREELPEHLTKREGAARDVFRRRFAEDSFKKESASREMRRPADIFAPKPGEKKPGGAASFGLVRMSQGTRVNHAMFGDGVILSARDLGGDILYEVEFDSGAKKKLMATYAKLKKI